MPRSLTVTMQYEDTMLDYSEATDNYWLEEEDDWADYVLAHTKVPLFTDKPSRVYIKELLREQTKKLGKDIRRRIDEVTNCGFREHPKKGVLMRIKSDLSQFVQGVHRKTHKKYMHLIFNISILSTGNKHRMEE